MRAMMSHLPACALLVLVILVLCTGCAAPGDITLVAPRDRIESFKELDAKIPSLSEWTVDKWNPGTDSSSVMERKVTCTSRDDQGNCTSATCEADEVSNCATWLFWCWWYGHDLGGDAQSATCSIKAFLCC
jgi:hypothetical protein